MFFLLYTDDLPDYTFSVLSVILLSILLMQQLGLVSGLESELWDTLDSGRKRLVDFSVVKSNFFFFFDLFYSNNCGAIYVKMNGSVLDLKYSFKMFVLPFSSELDWCSYFVSITKTLSFDFFYEVSFWSWSLSLFINKVVMVGLLVLSCYLDKLDNLQNGYLGLLGLLVVLHLSPWLINITCPYTL